VRPVVPDKMKEQQPEKDPRNMKAACRSVRFVWTVLFVATLTCLIAAQQPSDIQILVTSGNLEGMNWPNFSDYRTLLQKFYEPTGYAQAWIQGRNRYRRLWC